MENKTLGELGEEFATQYLISKGYKIIHRNYETSIGEIDIVAEINNILYIIEVKAGTQKSTKYFLPEQRVDKKKQNRLRKLAEIYVKQEKIHSEKTIQIDVISVIFNKNTEKPTIEHFENI